MSAELEIHDVVELAPCSIQLPEEVGTLREMAYRKDSYTPWELETIHTRFKADAPIVDIAIEIDRPLHGVRSKICELGLRRNSLIPWSEYDITYLHANYGVLPTSSIAAALGRTTPATYARAKFEGLTEQGNPPYSAWEDAQIRTGYDDGTPVSQIGHIIGRSVVGIASRASILGVKHAKASIGWTDLETARALELAESSTQYGTIATTLEKEGFPKRTKRAVGTMLRSIGYSRGWGRPWLAEEIDLLKLYYRESRSLTPLRAILNRSKNSIRYKADELNLIGSHANSNGFLNAPPWTKEELQFLCENYDKMPAKEIAAKLKRELRGIYCKAHHLQLNSSWMRDFTPDEDRAIKIAARENISLSILARAMNRDNSVVSKRSRRLGVFFNKRKKTAGSKSKKDFTLIEILAMDKNAGQPSALNN